MDTYFSAFCDLYFLFRATVRGTYFEQDRADIKKRIQLQDSVALIRENKNKFDSNAVAVADESGRRLGYIDREANGELAFLMDNGVFCSGIISAVNKEASTVGIAIDIYCRTTPEILRALRQEYQDILLLQELGIEEL